MVNRRISDRKNLNELKKKIENKDAILETKTNIIADKDTIIDENCRLDNLIDVDCFYHVYGERKDIEKNIAEYEGDSPSDYPGDLKHSSIAGYTYDKEDE